MKGSFQKDGGGTWLLRRPSKPFLFFWLITRYPLLPISAIIQKTNEKGHQGKVNIQTLRRIFVLLLLSYGLHGYCYELNASPPNESTNDSICSKECTAYVMYLLKKGGGPNSVDVYGNSPLHYAVLANDVQMTESLLDAGANVNIVDRYGCTPLILASMLGFDKIAECLIERECLLNIIGATSYGLDKAHLIANHANERTALMIACENGHVEIVKLLLKAGADTNKANRFGDTALILAVNMNNPKIAELLLEFDASTDVCVSGSLTLLSAAASGGLRDIVKLLLINDADVNAKNGQALFWATKRKPDPVMIEMLLEFGANPNARGGKPLRNVIRAGCIECVRILMKSGADPSLKDQDGTSALDLMRLGELEGIKIIPEAIPPRPCE